MSDAVDMNESARPAARRRTLVPRPPAGATSRPRGGVKLRHEAAIVVAEIRRLRRSAWSTAPGADAHVAHLGRGLAP